MTNVPPLDPSYVQYPQRRYGYDHDIYSWSNIHARKPVKWPQGKTVAVFLCVSLEWVPIVPTDVPFRAPGHMVTPYPDYRHYTARDYGNRVGAWRLLEAFDQAGVKASFAANAAVAERYPSLIEGVKAGGHEIIAHSTDMNATIDSSVAPETERRLIGEAIHRMQKASGVTPSGWLSIARSQSNKTLGFLKDLGLNYTCDWVNDELPYPFNNGLMNLPLNHELSDRQIITVQQQSAGTWGESMRDAFGWLSKEAAEQNSARLLPIHLTPYIMGLPYRIAALESLLSDLRARDSAWFARGNDIVGSWAAQE